MKNTKFYLWMALMILAGVALAACSESPAAEPVVVASNAANPAVVEQAPLAGNNAPVSDVDALPDYWVEEVPRLDEQGAVAVEIIPVKLNNPTGSIDFIVRMNTHSVDLSMNLAELATLSTDTGKTVQASSWDGPAGGHHVSGKLTFPASVDGATLLTGVKKLTLKLANVDAPERVFVWEK